MKKRVILLGPPGAGKGTQAKRLTVAMGVPHISTGDIFRDAIARGTQLGMQAKQYMDKGALVPDELVNSIVVERLAHENNGFLLDGFPRTIAQADALENAGEKIDAVILLDVEDDVLVNRITGRLTCPSCGSVFHKTDLPPKKDGVCDACGHELVQRADDNETTVRSRLANYHSQTQPLVEYYEKRGLVARITGEGTIEDKFNKIRKVLEF